MLIYQELLKGWEDEHNLQKQAGHFWQQEALVVVDPESMAKPILEIYHDGPTAGHPGVAKTFRGLQKHYWWPGMRKFVHEYVAGCAICQANKILTHWNNPDINPIVPVEGAKPFQTIAMDFIVKLPQSAGYDSILTITDHDCTKGVILLPCIESMNAEEVAQEYKHKVFPYVGLPSKIISDQDVRFTSHFAKEICAQLEIQQNLSSAYHPQTDGQSEKTNQHIKTALRIFCNH